MPGTINPSIPTIGEPNSTEDADIRSGMEALRDGLNSMLNSENKFDSTKFVNNSIEDRKLESPANTLFKVMHQAFGTAGSELVAGTYHLNNINTTAVNNASGGTTTNPLLFIYFDDEDYKPTNHQLKLRLRAQVATNATKPTIKFTFGLYPVTVAGGAGVLTPTLGTVVPGSTVELNEPALSQITKGTSGDFTPPADGPFVIGVVTSAKLNASAFVSLSTQLQSHSI